MLDIGWTELLLIGIVALIVIGPKDLPGMFHNLGKVTAKLRSMARDFTRAMEDAAKDSGVGDISKDLRNIANPKKMGLDALKDTVGDLDPFKDKPKSDTPMGENTRKLSEERAAAAKKMSDAMAQKARDRIAAEKAELEVPAEPAPATKPAKKPAAKKPAAKKPAAKKTAAKKPAAKKPAAKKAAPKPKKATE